MTEPLELEDITGLSLTMIGVLIEQYVKEGYADPTMYRALRAAGELAEQFQARVELNGAPSDFVQAVGELTDNIKLTAMECAEVVEKIIADHGWQDKAKGWDKPTACDNPDHGH